MQLKPKSSFEQTLVVDFCNYESLSIQQLSTPKETCPLTYENGFLPELPKEAQPDYLRNIVEFIRHIRLAAEAMLDRHIYALLCL